MSLNYFPPREFFDPPLYRIHDAKQHPGCFEVTGQEFMKQMSVADEEIAVLTEAHKYNADGWGIFWTVNEFKGPRKKENLTRLRAWFVECDSETKDKDLKRLQSKLMPSMIIESKRGFHAYWFAKDATVENYSDIIESRLVPYYRGDPNAKDISRILRVPDYFHCKDPTDKFLIRCVFVDPNLVYSESDILSAYDVPQAEKKTLEVKQAFKMDFGGAGDLWERVYNIDCEQALIRLSGSGAVNGETYSFKRTGSGKLNILVNGKSTSCWLDGAKRIGSLDRGGPTIFNWLLWYNHDKKMTYSLIKQYFPELFDA